MNVGNATIFDREVTSTSNWISLILILIAIWGIFGNTLVCLSIAMEKRLQNVTNYFLFSLAIADLLVCLLVMPISILNEFRNGTWFYGFSVCLFYISADVFLCSVSIVHMSLISFDRYWGISRPFKTRNKSKSVVTLKILSCWFITVLIASPIIVMGALDPDCVLRDDTCQIWNSYYQIYGSTLAFFIPFVVMAVTYGKTIRLLKQQQELYAAEDEQRGGCASPQTQKGIGGAVASTSFRMRRSTNKANVVVKDTTHYRSSNGVTLQNPGARADDAKSVTAKRNRVQSVTISSPNHELYPAGGNDIFSALCNITIAAIEMEPALAETTLEETELSHSAKEQNNNNGRTQTNILPTATITTSLLEHQHNNRSSSRSSYVEDCTNEHTMMQQSPHVATKQPATRGDKLQRSTSVRSTLQARNTMVASRLQHFKRATTGLLRPLTNRWNLANEQKATKVLGVVFFCFFVCWAPFFLMNTLLALCPDDFSTTFPPMLGSAFLWLGYISSTINPLIYTTFNRQFRIAFLRLLRCECHIQPRQTTITFTSPTQARLTSGRKYSEQPSCSRSSRRERTSFISSASTKKLGRTMTH